MDSHSEFSVPHGPLYWALWTIPAAGAVGAVIFTYWMTTPGAPDDPRGFAEWVTSTVGMLSGMIYILAVLGLVFGLMALYATVSRNRTGTLALLGVITGVLGIGMLVSALGSAVFGAAVVSDVYLDGNAGVEAALVDLSGGNFGQAVLIAFSIAILLALISAIANSLAIWRSGIFPKWSAVLFGVGFALFMTTTPLATHLGGILLAVSGTWIAQTLGQHRSTQTKSRTESRSASVV